jgi:hypothetical protein
VRLREGGLEIVAVDVDHEIVQCGEDQLIVLGRERRQETGTWGESGLELALEVGHWEPRVA